MEGGSSIPFEDPARPFVERLLATVRLAFTQPARLFSNVPDDGIGPPVLFALVVQTVSTLIGCMWQAAIVWLISAIEGIGLAQLAAHAGLLALFAVLSPLLVLFSLFVSAGVNHVMLLLVGDGKRGFAVTLRAQAYGGTPSLLGLVPVCGWIGGGLWAMVLTILGVYYGHKTDGWRAAVAYFLPAGACCCLMGWLFTSLGLLELLRG